MPRERCSAILSEALRARSDPSFSRRVRAKTRTLRPFPHSDVDAETSNPRAWNLFARSQGARSSFESFFERTNASRCRTGRRAATVEAGRWRDARGHTSRRARGGATRARIASSLEGLYAFAHRARRGGTSRVSLFLAHEKQKLKNHVSRKIHHRARNKFVRGCSSPWRLRTHARPRPRGAGARARAHRHLAPRRPRPRARRPRRFPRRARAAAPRQSLQAVRAWTAEEHHAARATSPPSTTSSRRAQSVGGAGRVPAAGRAPAREVGRSRSA